MHSWFSTETNVKKTPTSMVNHKVLLHQVTNVSEKEKQILAPLAIFCLQ